MENLNKCIRCKENISENKRSDAKFCSGKCKSAYWMEERRQLSKDVVKAKLIYNASTNNNILINLFNKIYNK